MVDFLVGNALGIAGGLALAGALWYVYAKYLKGKTL